MKSIWKLKNNHYDKLEKNINTEVLVIGGGLAGILTAYNLAKTHEVTLVERKTIGCGTTSRTTGKISAMQGIIYQSLIKLYGIDFAKKYYESQQTMINQYQEIIKAEHIDCDFEITDSILFANSEIDKLIDEYHAYQKINVPIELINNSNNYPIKFDKAIKLTNQAIFNPLKFLYGLPKNFTIYENTNIEKVTENMAYGNNFTIQAKYIIIATNFPIVDIPGFYFLKIHPSLAYTISFKDDLNLNGAYIEVSENGMSYRNYLNNILICGLDHRTGRSDNDEKLKTLLNKKDELSKQNYENYWSNVDMMTFDQIPYIGNISKSRPNQYVITGFNKWGMANSMLASIIISDFINKKNNDFAYLVSPFRTRLLLQIPNFIVNSFVNTKSILSSFLIRPIRYHHINESAKIEMINGIKKSIYIDKEGIKHYAPARCEHLKGDLHFNPNTLTWDCPCHGSRYNIDGEVIHGPAQK